jgi:signal transduction histidine kinase
VKAAPREQTGPNGNPDATKSELSGSARDQLALEQANADLRRRVAELETANRAAHQSRLATLNVLEDAMASRTLADALNQRLKVENGERRGVEEALRESGRRLEAALEAARIAHRAKDQFLAALSHELRTPLAPVLIAAGVGAGDDTLPKRVRERFAMIQANIEVEARLIDDLLDQTQIARGQMHLAKTPVDLHVILREAIRTTATEFVQKNIHVVKEFSAHASRLDGDPVRLQQIFWNLLRNAAKFTPPHGRVVVKTADVGENRVVTSISDTGIGLTPEEIERIFRPFSQGDHAAVASTKRFGGLGLGLTISLRLVELHGGSLKATSRGRDQGATFTVELPSLACTVARSTASPRSSPSSSPFRRLRILVVEDHAATRNVLKNLLDRRGHDAMSAGSVGEALQVSAGASFDLVLSDLGLPDGTGWELMKQLRAGHPGLIGIALSGYGMENDLKQTQEAGFSAHLIKPVTIEKLDEALRTVEEKLG